VKRWLFNSWIIGFFTSCLFAYVVTNIFMDSIDSHEYDSQLGKFTYSANNYYRMRREGWATTFIGKYNTIGVKDIEKNKLPKIAIWGDSEVTAFPVPDASKVSQQVSDMFTKIGREIVGFGIAHSNNTLADYIVDLRKYELLIPNIVSHYIVLCNLNDDTLPYLKKGPGCASFEYSNGFRLINSDCRPPYQKVFHQLGKFNLRIVSYSFGEIYGYQMQLPWARKKESKKNHNTVDEKAIYDKLEAWDFIISELRKQSDRPIKIIYCPYRPAILGRNISFKDSQQKDKEFFASICLRYNIGFIDLTERFNYFFLNTMKFPRGFANSFPGRGHLNADGHRLVAEAIFSNEVHRNSLKQ